MLRILFIASVALLTVQAVRFDIRNLEIGPVWVGIVGNDEKSVIENGGFVLDAGKSVSNRKKDNIFLSLHNFKSYFNQDANKKCKKCVLKMIIFFYSI